MALVVVVGMIKLQDHFLLTRRTEQVGVKQDLHSLQTSGKSHNVHLWYFPRFGLLQNRMDTKDPVPSSIGVVIPGSVRLAFWGGSVYTTPSGEAQDWGFPLWVVEGNEVGPLTSSTPRVDWYWVHCAIESCPARDSISSIADCANCLRDLRRGLVFRCTELLLKGWPSNCCAMAYVVLSQKFWRALICINWIDNHKRVDKGVTIGNCRMNRLLFAEELVLHEWIFSTGSSARIWSVFSCVRPSRNENQH